MKTQDYTATITVNASTNEVFKSISDVTKWWTENREGNSEKLNDEFTVHFGETFISMKVVEMISDQKIVWLVTDSFKHWVKGNKKEWNGTKIVFEIFQKDGKTLIRFTHQGLVPEYECFDACANAWGQYIQQSLFNLLTTGKGQPNRKEAKLVE